MSRKFSHIYQIINETNQKSYIGKTTQNIEKYIENHFRATESKKVLYRAIRKYGKENFSWKILWNGFASHDHLNNLELFFIAYYNTFKGIGYNCSPGGEGFTSGQKNPCSKTNMSKQKRIEKAQKANETKKERGVNIGQKNPCSKTNMSKQKRIEKGQKANETKRKNKTFICQTNPCSKTNMSKQKRIEKAIKAVETKKKEGKILSGNKNGHAKKFVFISPQNIKFKVFGGFETFCIHQKLYYTKMRININKGKIKPPQIITTISHKYTNNCTGWEVIKM